MKIKSIAIMSLLLGFVGSNQLVAHTDQSDEKQSIASQSKGAQVSLRGE